MKRLVIVCEGPTEQEFVRDVLQPHFLSKDIYIQIPLIKKSGGGIVPWTVLKTQIENHLREGDSFVTTLIDYYGIPDRFNYPGWQESKTIVDKSQRMDFLEQKMLADVDSVLRNRFIPYIQLHEFEGLLFNNIQSFENTFEVKEFKDKNELENILNQYDNPELINDNPNTAPSKRLIKLIEGYNKIVYGSILAETIGINNIRRKSPRFNSWIVKIEGL
ncbi:DUF4276 family protein [Zunongwangia pacifica]|uniref:DUF4276 family protein n=1 Tax=Zunongwangia pacifica TaxID=2911062 RepID=A0A9X2A1N1_9FLAO|nr:DUF4276 family protein [Zunongwangia pacifica]MCL6220406.1 DUF4276 family protein [Zunongwangia pacifica]